MAVPVAMSAGKGVRRCAWHPLRARYVCAAGACRRNLFGAISVLCVFFKLLCHCFAPLAKWRRPWLGWTARPFHGGSEVASVRCSSHFERFMCKSLYGILQHWAHLPPECHTATVGRPYPTGRSEVAGSMGTAPAGEATSGEGRAEHVQGRQGLESWVASRRPPGLFGMAGYGQKHHCDDRQLIGQAGPGRPGPACCSAAVRASEGLPCDAGVRRHAAATWGRMRGAACSGHAPTVIGFGTSWYC